MQQRRLASQPTAANIGPTAVADQELLKQGRAPRSQAKLDEIWALVEQHGTPGGGGVTVDDEQFIHCFVKYSMTKPGAMLGAPLLA